MGDSGRSRCLGAAIVAFCVGVACGVWLRPSTDVAVVPGGSTGSGRSEDPKARADAPDDERPRAQQRATHPDAQVDPPAHQVGRADAAPDARDAARPLIEIEVEVRDGAGVPIDDTNVRVGSGETIMSNASDEEVAERWTDARGRATFTLRSHAAYDVAVPIPCGEFLVRVVPEHRGQVISISLPRSVEVSVHIPADDPPVTELLLDPVKSGGMDGRLGEGRRFRRSDRHIGPEYVEVERIGARTVIQASEGVEYTVSRGCDCRSAPFFAVPGATVTVPACAGRVLSIDVAARHPPNMRALRFAIDGVASRQRVDRSGTGDVGSIRLCVPRRRGTVEWSGERHLPGSAAFDLDQSRSLSIKVEEPPPIAAVLPGAAVRFLSVPDFASHLGPIDSATVTAFGLGDDGQEWHEVGRFGGDESATGLRVSRGTQVLFVVASTAGPLPFYAGPTKIDDEQTTIARMEPGGFVAPMRGPRIGRTGVAVTVSRDDGTPLPYSQGNDVAIAAAITVRPGTLIGPLPPGPVTLEFRSLGQVVARTRVVVKPYAAVPAEFDAAE